MFWIESETATTNDDTEEFVLKEAAFDDNDDFTFYELDYYRKDGIISAATSPHPLMVDVYGYCAIGLLSEYMNNDNLDNKIVSLDRCEEAGDDAVALAILDGNSSVVAPDEDGDDEDDSDDDESPVYSSSPLTAVHKLQIALDMANGVALLHNHPHGVIVHDDINLSQFLLTSSGEVKLNDFNRAYIMSYDHQRQKYCKYSNGNSPGDVRNPRPSTSRETSSRQIE